jgi:Holliday junction DNA helicase RuvB
LSRTSACDSVIGTLASPADDIHDPSRHHNRLLEDESNLDTSLRPRRLDDFVGQDALKENLRIALVAARGRGEAVDHLLLYGPPGLGKTTLAQIVARELDVPIVFTSGPALERPGDLAGLLTNLGERGILFIDEIHRLHPVIEEYLYPAMEDFNLDIVIDRGPGARSVRCLPPS